MEDEMVTKNLTVRELVYNMLDGTWNPPIDVVRSQKGGFLSIAAGGASGDFSSQLTKTDLLSGDGTLSSAGMKFHLQDLYVVNQSGKKCTITVVDGTTTMLMVIMPTAIATTSHYAGDRGVGTMVAKDLKGLVCLTDCRIVAGTGPVHARVGGLIKVILA